jgi:NTE family protein
MTRVHVLRGRDRVFGFTLDEQGTNLPGQYGPWTTFKTIELYHDEPHQGVDVSACLDDIGKHGFHLTDAHKRITHMALGDSKQMRHKNVALVLGGGGSAGQAWTIGVIAGLAEAGIDMTEAADLVIGTSSGATAAAQVRSGIPPAELLASTLSPPARPVGQNRPTPQGPPMSAVFERMRSIGAAATSAADLQRAMGAFGLESDATLGPAAAEHWRATVAARLPGQQWPDRPMIVPAVNAHTGELAVFDRDSGVDLVDAVTAGTALPGVVPTHNINGTPYINGGVRSAENADLATGYANVVVISPFGGRTGPLPPGQFEGMRRFPGADLESEVEALRQQGSRVEVITPDADSQVAMGTNQMDPATRIPAARAGFAQGKLEATRLTFL